jgi:hypothetical protein
MDRSGIVSLSAVDIAGGTMVAACVLAAVWLTAVRGDDVKSEIVELRRVIQTSQDDLASLRAAHDRQHTTLAQREVELGENGHLPEQTPIEEYFQMLSNLAAQHRLHVVRNNPLSARQYPGLLEQRFVYEVTGTLPDLVRFIEAIDHSKFWADIGYLKLDSGRGVRAQAPDERVATLTLSLFSALPSAASTGSG